MRVNLARGVRRIWVIGTALWIPYSIYHYRITCSFYFYPKFIRCPSLHGDIDYTTNQYYVQYFMTLIEKAIGVPILVFVLGTVVLWVGRWVAKGFRPSQPQTGG